jgi:hypothetical protein
MSHILRGARKSSCIIKHPELLTLTLFGSEKGKDYNEVLMDVLAMWAKGYLQPAPGQNQRLELSRIPKLIIKDPCSMHAKLGG